MPIPSFRGGPPLPGAAGAEHRWREVHDFDFTEHVREVRLPSPGDDAALQEYVGGFLATPLPRDRPLWDIHLIDGLMHGSAIYVRLHHALADGIAFTQIPLSLTDATAEEAGDRSGAGEVRHHGVGDLLEAARRATPEMTHVLGPARIVAALSAASHTGLRGAGVFAKLLLTRDPESAVAGAAGSLKRAVWSDPIDLQLIKDIAMNSDATVNDVLVSALAGALERYQLEHRGSTVDISTMFPVNLRPMHLPPPRDHRTNPGFDLRYVARWRPRPLWRRTADHRGHHDPIGGGARGQPLPQERPPGIRVLAYSNSLDGGRFTPATIIRQV